MRRIMLQSIPDSRSEDTERREGSDAADEDPGDDHMDGDDDDLDQQWGAHVAGAAHAGMSDKHDRGEGQD